MGKHSTPCKYVQERRWCRLCSAQGQARFVVLPGAEPLCRRPPGDRLRPWRDPLPCLPPQGGEAPTATRGWTSGAPPSPSSPLLLRAARGAQVSRRGAPGSQRGVWSGKNRCFLAREHHGRSLPAATPRSAPGEAPVQAQGWRSHGPAGKAERTTTPASSRSRIHGQESHSLPEQGLHLGEVCSRGQS